MILMPHGAISALAADMHIGRVTVWRALTMRINTERSRAIRDTAIAKFGGQWTTLET